MCNFKNIIVILFLVSLLILPACSEESEPSTPPRTQQPATQPTTQQPTAAVDMEKVEPQTYTLEKNKMVAIGDFHIATAITAQGLSILPIIATKKIVTTDYITLDEGVKAGLIKVQERNVANTNNNLPVQSNGNQQVSGNSASVNELYITNNSDKPLYLMSGEIVIGGKQDRTIAQDMIIPSKNKPIALNVFCVEHERWSNRTAADNATFYSAMNADADLSVVFDLQAGEFTSSLQTLSSKGRKTAQDSNSQSEVWEEVANENSKNVSATRSASYLNNMSNPKVKIVTNTIVKEIEQAVASIENIVGVVVVVNGKIQAVDIFANHNLFVKLWPKLLRSYSLDVTNVKLDENIKVPKPNTIREQLIKLTDSKVTDSKDSAQAKLVKTENETLINFDCYSKTKKVSKVNWTQGFVHRNLYIKDDK